MIENKPTKINKFAFLLFSTLVFVLPIFFLPLNILGFTEAKVSLFAILTLLVFCLLIVDVLKKGELFIYRQWGYLCMFLSLCASVVSVYGNHFLPHMVFGSLLDQDTLFITSISFLFVSVTSVLVNSPRRIKNTLALFLISVFFSSVIQIIHIFIPKFTLGLIDLPIITLSGNWSDLSLLVTLLLFVVVAILTMTKIKKWVYYSLLAFLPIPFLFITLSVVSFDFYFFSASLSSLICFFAVIGFAYFYSLSRVSKSKSEDSESEYHFNFTPSLVVLILSLAVLVFYTPLSRFLISKTQVTYFEGRPNWQSTLIIAYQNFKEHHFFGTGLNTFEEQWSLRKTADVNMYPFWNTDFQFGVGILPTIATTLGVVGFVIYCLFYLYVVWICSQLLFDFYKSRSGITDHIIVPSLTLLSTFIIAFNTPGFVVVVSHFLFLGLLFSVANRSVKLWTINIQKNQASAFFSVIFVIIAVLSSIYVMYLIVVKDLANHSYRKAFSASHIDEGIMYMSRAVNFDPENPLYHQGLAEFYVAKLNNLLSTSKVDTDTQNFLLKNAIQFSVNTETLNPYDYKNKMATGKILQFLGSLGLKDAFQAAEIRYQDAHKLNPANPLPLLLLTQVNLNQNKKTQAKEFLLQALALKSNYSDTPELEKEVKNLIDSTSPAREVPKATSTKNK